MSAPLRITTNLATTAALATLLLLGGMWLRDRTHRWEQPRWVSGCGESGRLNGWIGRPASWWMSGMG